MTNIPLNNAVDLSKLAAPPIEVGVTIQWEDQSKTVFSLEDIQGFDEPSYRLFMLCLLGNAIADPRFVARFKPTDQPE